MKIYKKLVEHHKKNTLDLAIPGFNPKATQTKSFVFEICGLNDYKLPKFEGQKDMENPDDIVQAEFYFSFFYYNKKR